MFAGAGARSADGRLLRRLTWSHPIAIGLLGLAVAAAVLTWVALLGVNPIHLSDPTP